MKLKWREIATGGGCEALEALLPNGRYILITAHDDPTLPQRGEPVSVGWYGEDGYSVDPPDWAIKASLHPPASCEEPLMFPNVTVAKRVLSQGYKGKTWKA